MKSLFRNAAFVLSIAAGTAAYAAQDPTVPVPAAAAAAVDTIRSGATLTTADGRRLGRIDKVYNGADGKAERVSVIYDSRFISIPVSTLSATDKGFVTSLTKAEVRKLN